MKPERHKRPRPPLDGEALERIALFYAGRYATTRAKLGSYLARKVRERGWTDGGTPEIEPLVERMAKLGYIDDRAFATSRAASLQRRGFGERRLDQALHAAGISAADAEEARATARDGAMKAALRYAERKRLGPYAETRLDRDGLQKAFGAMLRAGHPMAVVRRVLEASPGHFPDLDAC